MFDCIGCMGTIPIPDQGYPKPNGEYLVSGKFFTTGGKTTETGNVKVNVADMEKELYVFGSRQWTTLGKSKLEPISEMPVDYEHAFGGEGFEDNPQGMGYKDGSLPCIENPKQLITAKGNTPSPVGFGPIDMALPVRACFRGNYDDYMDKYFPGFPESTDMKYFLTAPEDQRIDDYFFGDETYRIEHMHPEVRVIEGRLPNLKARCFINYSPDYVTERESLNKPVEAFFEKPLNLDTIWLFPEKLKGMLIWRGVVETESDDGKEIDNILVGYERISDTPRTLEDYRQALQLRLDTPEDRLLNHFKTGDLIPLGEICAIELMTEIAIETSGDNPVGDNMSNKIEIVKAEVEEKKQEVIQQLEEIKEKNKDIAGVEEKMQKGIDALQGKTDTESDPVVDKLMADIEKVLPGISSGKIDMKEFSFTKLDELTALMNAFSEEKKTEALGQIDQAKKELIEKVEELKKIPDVSAEKIAEMEKSIAAMDIDLDNPEPAPLFRVRKDELYQPIQDGVEKFKKGIEGLRKQVSIDNPNSEMLIAHIKGMEEQVTTSEQQIDQLVTTFRESYILGAHMYGNGLSPHSEPLEVVKSQFLEKVRSGQSVSGGDYACIDLSGENLDGIDLSGALMEQVNLTGASLKGANLENCVLARASLMETDFTGSNLKGTNLGFVSAPGANFSQCDLDATIFYTGAFPNSKFVESRIQNTQLIYADFQQADFTRAELPDQIWVDSNFKGAIFRGVKLIYSAFASCDFSEVDFSQAEAISCAFVDSKFDRSKFAEANLNKSCFVGDKSTFKETDFRRGLFNQTNFLGMPLQGVDFSEAEMVNALFNTADLTESRFCYAQAKTAQFREAILINANCDNMQLWEGSLAKANIVGASFVGANLAYTDFLRCTMGNTNFKNANLDRTLIQDWRPS